MRELSPSDIIRQYQADSSVFRGIDDEVTVAVPRLGNAAYRDIVDAAFALRGPRIWRWRDARGREERRQSLFRALLNLGFDAVSLPFFVAKHYLLAAACVARGRRLKSLGPDLGCLYLRMDHTFDLRSGGSVAHVAGVINALRQLVSQVTVVSSDLLPLVEPDREFYEVIPHATAMRNVPNFPPLTYTTQIVNWWVSQETGRLPMPGFIYARYSVGNYAAPVLRHLLNVPYVCEYNGSAVWISRHWGKGPMRFERLFQKIEDANLLGADLIVAVSDASRAELVERGYPEDRILVNPNGVDTAIYHPDIDGKSLRQRLGIGVDEVVVGFVGTFGQWHGAEVLAKAFCNLLKDGNACREQVRLLLVGDGLTMSAVKDIVKAAGAEDRVVFSGVIPQTEAPEYLAVCDVLASPHVPNPDGSRFFGSPTKLFEYMAMGRAIVASRLEQIGDILRDGQTAILVPPGDADALCDKLRDLVANPSLRGQLGCAARADAEQYYTWQRHTEKILSRLQYQRGPQSDSE